MARVAIRVRGLGKRYRIGAPGDRRFRTRIERALRAPFRKDGGDGAGPDVRYVWALSDVTFDVERGETVAVVGRNGAGKSALLRVLSRITRPTSGYAELHGSVGAMLEVGTGFHPELTGRENVYLQGALMGMTRAAIAAEFDAIVEFAQVERFLDTPVKHYSSGMYMRLAFAIAVHARPEILLVDEVLAVGDVEFQQRCLARIREFSDGGGTVLFVTHDLSLLGDLCRRALHLEAGRLVLDADVARVVSAYRQGAAVPRPAARPVIRS